MSKRDLLFGALCVGLVVSAGQSRARADFQTATYTFETQVVKSPIFGSTYSPIQTNWGFGTDPLDGSKLDTKASDLWNVYTLPNGTRVTDNPNSPSPEAPLFKDPFEIPQFNPANFPVFGNGDRLSAVNIKMSYEIDNTFYYTYTTPSTITVGVNGGLRYNLPSSTPLLFPGQTTNTIGINHTEPRTLSPNDILGHKILGLSTSETNSVSRTFATNGHDAVSSQYLGTGMIQIPVIAFASSFASSNSGNGFGQAITQAMFTFSISYTFVPEPSSVVLLGIGGMGLLWSCRRQIRGHLSKAA